MSISIASNISKITVLEIIQLYIWTYDIHRSHLVGYDSGLASLTASSSYTRHLFESLSAAIANCHENDEV